MLYTEGNQPEVLESINIMSLTRHIFQLDSMRLCDTAATVAELIRSPLTYIRSKLALDVPTEYLRFILNRIET